MQKLLTKTVSTCEDLIACLVDWAERENVVCIGASYEADWQINELDVISKLGHRKLDGLVNV